MIKLNPTLLRVDAVVPQLQASALRKLGFVNEATKAYEKGLKRFPSACDLMNSFGNLLLEAGQNKKALMLFSKANKINSKSYDYKYNLARTFFAEERYAEAEKNVRELIKAHPLKLDLLLMLSSILSQEGQNVEAEKYLVQILEIDPSNIKALNNLGNIKRRIGQQDEALICYQRALDTGVAGAEIYQNLAAILALKGTHKESFEVYEQGLSKYPLNVTLHKEYAHFAWIQNVNNPFALLEKVLSTEQPGLVMAYAELMLKVDDFEKAKLWLEKLVAKQDPTIQIAAVASLSNALRGLGQFQEALNVINSLPNTKSAESLPLLIEKSYSLLSLDRAKEAISVLELVCRIAPLNQGYWTLLSTAYKANGDEIKYQTLCQYQDFINVTSLLEGSEENTSFIGELAEYLNTLHSSTQHPIGQSLRNGTQTFENLLDSEHHLIQTLKSALKNRAESFVCSLSTQKKHPFLSRIHSNLRFIGSWSVRLRKAGFHKSHYHSEGWLSGVLYVDVPDEVRENGNGWLVFGRPDIKGVEMLEDFAIKPIAGNVVFFPSYMWHGTNPIYSDTQRLTVAFDIVPES
ncbi:putative 2OG-Fe(II) oxygenase [Alteromonas sp. CI.11.F.A3]|uniref:putative 2OG-Fe(II) oxygenase n=1 Tax=Alteromonas sp. CI.11.F.A3 TaxID=3079555 RepID=UPI002943CEDC|nr:putative 2OG-Fe(II) oxygenase [Alteromonas sp. CI.11.F.A3]WOI36556.1 putative 2OG-Fe(II) oxygenase [Alteromonas sp. CI.11.F.A3]